jgi:hypothetical protein
MSKPATAAFILNAARAIGVVAEQKPPTPETPEQRKIGFLCRRLDAVLSELDAVHRENTELRQLVEGKQRDWLTVAEAAKAKGVNRSEKCIRWRCKHKNLGKKTGSSYRIYPDQLRRHFGLPEP